VSQGDTYKLAVKEYTETGDSECHRGICTN